MDSLENDLMMYGNAYVTADGQRIDPVSVVFDASQDTLFAWIGEPADERDEYHVDYSTHAELHDEHVFDIMCMQGGQEDVADAVVWDRARIERAMLWNRARIEHELNERWLSR